METTYKNKINYILAREAVENLHANRHKIVERERQPFTKN
jgi:hypothetical protein